jgi:glycosyltransferase involved in cell wall biosynthesis
MKKKIGLLITTYNRPEYLKQCLNSIWFSDRFQLDQVLIVDDCSTDETTMALIFKCPELVNADVIIKETNSGIHRSISIGCDRLFLHHQCDTVITIDGDTLVKPEWINALLTLHDRFPTNISSGFNTLVRHPGQDKPRHDVHEWFDTYVTKHSIGGINMVFSFSIYHKIIKPCLVDLKWDARVSHEFKNRFWVFTVTRPSVVQHIGLEEGMHMTNNPDIAYDF